MGSICKIWEPENWKIKIKGKSKILKDDIIYQMIIGECEDYTNISNILILISKENYENILNKNYTIKKQPYNELPVLLYNEEKENISLVKEEKGKKLIKK